MPDNSSRLQFAVATRGTPALPYPNVVLGIDRWDDFGFQTMFDAELRIRSGADMVRLGKVKILQRGLQAGRPALESRFRELSADFCSLGQDIEYYETLMGLSTELRRTYLLAIRDAAYNPAIEASFDAEPGWSTSLLRHGQAVHALNAGRELLRGNRIETDRLSFQFNWRPQGGSHTPISFEFDDSFDLPGRCHVLIGYNGVGKTTLLADLAIAASAGRAEETTDAPEDAIVGEDNTFGAVVAVSYSAFDTFRTPDLVRGSATKKNAAAVNKGQTEVFGYVYCGLRRQTSARSRASADLPNAYELKSIDEIQSEFAAALKAAGRRGEGGHLVAAFQALAREPSFGQVGIDLTSLGAGLDSDGAIEAFGQLSTGHKIVLNIVTQLAAHLRTRSLVLIDEPETHLHPPLVAALLRAIQVLLTAHGSFAVIATHSPVVVQEMPSQYVNILERYSTSMRLRRPEIETFAENIGAITRHVFSLDSSATDYQGILAELAGGHELEHIDSLFINGLSNQGRALVANYLSQS